MPHLVRTALIPFGSFRFVLWFGGNIINWIIFLSSQMNQPSCMCACFHQAEHSFEKQATCSLSKLSDLENYQLKIKPGIQVHGLFWRLGLIFHWADWVIIFNKKSDQIRTWRTYLLNEKFTSPIAIIIFTIFQCLPSFLQIPNCPTNSNTFMKSSPLTFLP